MGMSGVLLALSAKRQAMLGEDPELLAEVIESRHDDDIPGLLDLGESWHALDLLLGGEGDPLRGEIILARGGRKFGPDFAFGRGRLLAPPRVAEVSKVLATLVAADIVDAGWKGLAAKQPHGGEGPADDKSAADAADERADLADAMEELQEFYAAAAKRGDAVLALVV